MTPIFDAEGYANEGPSCTATGTCCPDPFFSQFPYWHCGAQSIKIETDIPFNKMMDQVGATADKLRRRDWDATGERFGVVWVRRPVEILQGGGVRVKKLIKQDLGLTQTTQFDYGVGEMAQYPDSVMSRAFASRFATGAMTDVFGADPADVPGLDPRFHDLPPMSRVDGIGDEDLDLLPGANITYPEVTARNLVEENGQMKEANGKTIYRFLGPERKGGLQLHIEPFQDASGAPSKLTVEYLDAGGNPVFIRKILQARNNGDQNYYEDFQPTLLNRRVTDIRTLRFSYGSPAQTVSLPFNSQGKDKAEYRLTGSYTTGTLTLSQIEPPILSDFEFPAILVKRDDARVLTYDDYTSRLGMATTTTYLRNSGTSSNPEYLLVKKDSTVYKHAAPSIDNRFLTTATADKLGTAKESWQYVRVRHCDPQGTSTTLPACKDSEKDSKWKSFHSVDFDGTEKEYRHIVHPTFPTDTWTFTGFNGSRQEASSGQSDFLITHIGSHLFNAVTGQPTLTVTYAGGSPTDPSKVTRMTPAFQVDPTASVSTLPNTMFGLNMLDQNFREDAFTFDTATTSTNKPDGTPINFDLVNLGGTDADNGGDLASRLTSVKITPLSQTLLTYPTSAGRPNPILSLGNFTSKFDNVSEAFRTRQNTALVAVQPDLNLWNGVRIAMVNALRKPLQMEDVYDRATANRFDHEGFRQIGLFANAKYAETAVLVPEEMDICSDLGPKTDKWFVMNQSECGSLETGYIDFPYNINLQHTLDVEKNGRYSVEWQAHVAGSRVIRVALVADDGRIGAEEQITLTRGLSRYSTVLDVSSGFGSSIPAAGECKLVFQGLSGPQQGQVRINYLRAYPEKAQAVTYTYDSRGNMVQKVDETSLSTYYEYDLFGKLIAIKNDDGQIISEGHKELVNASN